MTHDCELCGCKGFSNAGALASHKATSRACKLARSRKDRDPVEAPVEAPVDASTPGHLQSQDFINMTNDETTSDALANFESVFSTPLSDFLRGNQPETRFDSTLHLVAFIRRCRNTLGLSVKDTRKLLGLLFHPSFSLEDVQIKTISDLLRYEAKIASDVEPGWREMILREKDGHVPRLTLHYQDPIEVLSRLFSDPRNKSGFKLSPDTEAANVYSTLDTGSWWMNMQKLICVGGVIAAVILYSDQTSLSNNRSVSDYPLMMSLANIDCKGRREEWGHALLAILPTYGGSDPDVVNSRKPARTKLHLFHKCLKTILAPLKALSFTGLPLDDPWGYPKWVYPELYSYNGDHPETCKVTCTFDTNRCQYPCSVCMCPKDRLSDVESRHAYRTQSQMSSLYNEMVSSRTPSNMSEDMARDYSVHPIECALWGFFGDNTDLGNTYRAIHPDKMHQFELGLFKTFITILRDMSTSSDHRIALVRKPLETLDERMIMVAHNHRYPEFRLPATGGRTGYFVSNATFEAFEHRSVLQVLIPLLVGIFPTYIVQIAIDLWEWYTLAFRTPEHTEESLDKMDKLMSRMVRRMVRELRDWQKSNFELIKIHMMSHLSDSIRRSGVPCEYSTDMYEHFHIMLMKVPYRASNKKNFAKQMTRHHQRLLAIGRKLPTTTETDHEERETALDKAVASRVNILTGLDLRFQVYWLEGPLDDIPSTTGRELLRAQPEIQSNLSRALKQYMTENVIAKIEVLEVKKGLAISAGVGDRFGSWPMIARATRLFHDRPYFSHVSIQMEAAGEQAITYFGQLRLLFSCKGLLQDGANVTKDLALVHLYDLDREDRITLCKVLRPVEAFEAGSSENKASRRRRREPYLIVDVANVLKVLHLIPHYGGSRNNEYLVNRFKF